MLFAQKAITYIVKSLVFEISFHSLVQSVLSFLGDGDFITDCVQFSCVETGPWSKSLWLTVGNSAIGPDIAFKVVDYNLLRPIWLNIFYILSPSMFVYLILFYLIGLLFVPCLYNEDC